MKSDVTVNELRKKNYIPIKYTGSEEWDNYGSNISYGSAQNWFANYDMDVETNNGCGLIAISDLTIYLSYYDPYIDLQGLGLYDPVNDLYNYDAYMDYLLEMLKDFPVYGELGNIDAEVPFFKFTRYLNKQLNDYYEVHLNISDDSNLTLNHIEAMIEDNIPVIMSFDNTIQNTTEYIEEIIKKYYAECTGLDLDLDLSLDKNLQLYEFNEEKNSFEISKYGPIESHYMTITGIRKYSNESAIKNYKDIPSETMLQVSSWGRKYYISYEEYAQSLSLFSNILVVRRSNDEWQKVKI